MFRTPPHRTLAHHAIAVVVALAVPAASAAQSASVTAVTAAYLYNFAKFTEWPPDVLPMGARLDLCVVGDALVADALDQTIRGRRIDGHELAVRVLDQRQSAAGCHLLYLPATEVPRRLESARAQPILSVSDDPEFARQGGVVQLRLEKERMLFTVNVTAAERSRLRLSSKLLSLARIHREPPR